jgi:hypothetical protein
MSQARIQALNELAEPKELYKELGGKNNARAIQTFFRNSYRSHNSLSALADRKANIMVRLNSLLISLLLVFFSEIVERNVTAMAAAGILLLTCLVSLVFAALAARPDVTQQPIKDSPKAARQSIFFFGNFIQLEMPRYEEIMSEVLGQTPMIYRNMVRDLYYLGKVLDKKFKQLKLSYNIFILGFLLAVSTFLVASLVS